MMLTSLNREDRQWVERTMASMSMEEKVGHLICLRDLNTTAREFIEQIKDRPIGNLFVAPSRKGEELREYIAEIQDASRLPLLVTADVESCVGGPLGFGDEYTEFPAPMACAAAGDSRKVYEQGLVTAREARHLGINCTLGPVVDININPRNAVVNYRAYGDDPEVVKQFSVQRIMGTQRDGLLAACPKHFPGDGMDERDQHFCTSINSLSVEDWFVMYGKVWKAVIDAGAMCIMAGHISFPAYEELSDQPRLARPATLSRKLQVDLLRHELGFEGVIISDAIPMGGMTSWIPAGRLAADTILAGSDIALFADVEDYDNLMKVVKDGGITEQRIDESVQRILALKARLGLNKNLPAREFTKQEVETSRKLSQTITDDAITVLRRGNGGYVANLKKGDKALLVNVIPSHASRGGINLDTLSCELEKRGIETTAMLLPSHREVLSICDDFDWIFVNLCVIPHGVTGTIRLAGELLKPFYRTFWACRENVTFTSFCSPYVLYDMPQAGNMLCTYDYSTHSQISAVKVWLGELVPTGKRPVRQMREEIGF